MGAKVLPRNTQGVALSASITRPVAIKVGVELKERVKRLAVARDRTPHWLMLEAIRQFVEREEQRESFRQDAIRAWEDYQVNGLHVTLEEADGWLAALDATDQDVAPPEPHN